jgi:2-dehydro-3-deoxyphosphogluconate aldolase/(4S)-4-hydroxy-2-oxoglutarate aldolase
VNSGSPEKALEDAKLFAKLLGWEIRDGNSSMFVGNGIELMKKPFKGTHGHICIATNFLARAKWHLERRGFEFVDESEASYKNGKMTAIYLKNEIAGYAVHLLQK